MTRALLFALILSGAALMTLHGQEHDHAAMLKNQTGGTSTLSKEQIAQLLAGEGMGLAKPAELNHYPGPKHVLELAEALTLSAEQRGRVEAIRNTMLTAAKKLGAEIVDAERTLDMSFQKGHIDEDRLNSLTHRIGTLQGELRAVHLSAHLATRQVLTPSQVEQYDISRGYAK